MQWPDNNPIASIMKQAHDIGTVSRVAVGASLVEPFVVSIIVTWRRGSASDTEFDLVLPKADLLMLDTQIEETAWVMGAPDMRRVASSEPSEVGGGYCWLWKPVYGSSDSPLFENWLSKDRTLESDGSRKLPYPYYPVHHLLEAARMYPAAASRRMQATLFVFRCGRRNAG